MESDTTIPTTFITTVINNTANATLTNIIPITCTAISITTTGKADDTNADNSHIMGDNFALIDAQ